MAGKRKRGRPVAVDPLSTHAQIRCKPAEKAAWFQAAGGRRAFSEWARRVLNEAVRAR